MKQSVLLILVITLCSCSSLHKEKTENTEIIANETKNEIIVYELFDQLEQRWAKPIDSSYIINFWATSCKPCIEEMPYFEQLGKKYKDSQLNIIMVSLDTKGSLETRVIPFVDKWNIKNEVVLLADQNYSQWTEKIDSSWFGALPATLIIHNNKRNFHFGAFESLQELELLID